MADELETSIRNFVILHPTTVPVFGERYHLNKLPDDIVYPCIRATTISDVPKYHQQGSGLGKALVQMDVLHEDKIACNSATETLYQVFDGYRGNMGVYRVRTFVKNVPSSWESNVRYFRRILEVEIGYAKEG